MTNTNATNFRKDIYKLLQNTIRYNEPVHITTKDGDAILISEAEYRGLVETLDLISVPEMEEKLLDGMNAPLSECLPEDAVEW